MIILKNVHTAIGGEKMQQVLERGVLLLALGTALITIVLMAMFFSAPQQESRAFADAQYVCAYAVETEDKP